MRDRVARYQRVVENQPDPDPDIIGRVGRSELDERQKQVGTRAFGFSERRCLGVVQQQNRHAQNRR